MVTSWKTLSEWAFKFFKGSLEPFVGYFDSIKSDLLRSNIGLGLSEYVYVSIFITLFAFVLEFPIVVIIMSILFQEAAIAFLFSLSITIVIVVGIFFFFYTYPSMIAGRRRKDIEAALPFATTYMATIAASGAPLVTMFKVMVGFEEYGEISKEFEKIYRDVEVFGMDLLAAIRKTASRTPSEELKELLWGLESILTSGSNVENYLREKSRLFIAEFRRRLEKYSDTLSLFIEIYLTVVLVGSVFFIIMTSLMSIIGGGSNVFMVFLQFVVVFAILPVVSIAFIVLLKVVSPSP